MMVLHEAVFVPKGLILLASGSDMSVAVRTCAAQSSKTCQEVQLEFPTFRESVRKHTVF